MTLHSCRANLPWWYRVWLEGVSLVCKCCSSFLRRPCSLAGMSYLRLELRAGCMDMYLTSAVCPRAPRSEGGLVVWGLMLCGHCLDIFFFFLISSLKLDFVSEVWLDDGARELGASVHMWSCTPLSPYFPGTNSWLPATQLLKRRAEPWAFPEEETLLVDSSLIPCTRGPSLSSLTACPIDFSLAFLALTITWHTFLKI